MINPQIPTNPRIKKFVKQLLFGDRIFCPECKSFRVVRYQERYRCRKCALRFSLLSHTYLGKTKLPLTTIWYAIWCFINAIPVKQAQSFTDLSEKGVRHWYDLLRCQLPTNQPVLAGKVQVDEVYVGGWGGRAIIAAKAIETKQIAFHICETHEVYRTDILGFIQRYITPGSTVYTDSYPLYRGIDRLFGVFHYRDIHQKFEFTHTSEIEGLFGNFRTFIGRIYHHISKEKLPEYAVEFQARFSHKNYFKSVDQFLLNTLKLLTTG